MRIYSLPFCGVLCCNALCSGSSDISLERQPSSAVVVFSEVQAAHISEKFGEVCAGITTARF